MSQCNNSNYEDGQVREVITSTHLLQCRFMNRMATSAVVAPAQCLTQPQLPKFRISNRMTDSVAVAPAQWSVHRPPDRRDSFLRLLLRSQQENLPNTSSEARPLETEQRRVRNASSLQPAAEAVDSPGFAHGVFLSTHIHADKANGQCREHCSAAGAGGTR